jgi:hypothetical protein
MSLMPALQVWALPVRGASAGEGKRDPCQPLRHLRLVQVVEGAGLMSTRITAAPKARPFTRIGTGHVPRVASSLRRTPIQQRQRLPRVGWHNPLCSDGRPLPTRP